MSITRSFHAPGQGVGFDRPVGNLPTSVSRPWSRSRRRGAGRPVGCRFPTPVWAHRPTAGSPCRLAGAPPPTRRASVRSHRTPGRGPRRTSPRRRTSPLARCHVRARRSGTDPPSPPRRSAPPPGRGKRIPASPPGRDRPTARLSPASSPPTDRSRRPPRRLRRRSGSTLCTGIPGPTGNRGVRCSAGRSVRSQLPSATAQSTPRGDCLAVARSVRPGRHRRVLPPARASRGSRSPVARPDRWTPRRTTPRSSRGSRRWRPRRPTLGTPGPRHTARRTSPVRVPGRPPFRGPSERSRTHNCGRSGRRSRPLSRDTGRPPLAPSSPRRWDHSSRCRRPTHAATIGEP